jgi:hypothetical protein
LAGTFGLEEFDLFLESIVEFYTGIFCYAIEREGLLLSVFMFLFPSSLLINGKLFKTANS